VYISDHVLMDVDEFESPSYQRVYQYIQQYTDGEDLDSFSCSETAVGTPQECVEKLLQ
jgi:hypothetical protein